MLVRKLREGGQVVMVAYGDDDDDVIRMFNRDVEAVIMEKRRVERIDVFAWKANYEEV